MATDKKISYEIQGGVKNYKPSKMVTAPKTARSSPKHPTAHLAYITKKEQNFLVKKNLHGSLKGKPNKGPAGIVSLQGDFGGPGGFGGFRGGGDYSSAETGNLAGFSGYSGPELPPGVDPKGSKEAQDIRSAAINAGAGQRVNPGFFDSRTRLSPNERLLAKTYRNRRTAKGELANKYAKKAYRKTGQGGLRGFLTSGGIFGNLIRGVGQKFGWGKKWNEPTYDMSEYSRYGLGGVPPGTLDEDENEKISETSSSPVNNEIDYNDVFGYHSLIGNDETDETDETVARPATNLYPSVGLGAADGGLVTLL